MNRTILALLCFILCMGTRGTAQENVRVREKKVIVRHKDNDRPAQGSTIIRYPLLSGLSNPALLRRLQTAVMPQGEYKGSLDKMKRDTWLTEVEYRVNCNRKAILDVSYTLMGMGAYPDSFDEHITLNLKTGKRLKARDLFIASQLPKLATLINRSLQADKQQAINNPTIKNSEQETREWVRQSLSSTQFQAKDLDKFTVSAKGVTFYYDFGFPHAIEALEPKSQYFFSYASLKPFVRREGPLNAFLK